MIITDFHFIGVSTRPKEADSPLVIYADTVLTLPISFQSLQPVAGKYPQILKTFCRIYVAQFSESYGLNILWDFWVFPVEELFSFLLSESLYHECSVWRYGLQVKKLLHKIIMLSRQK